MTMADNDKTSPSRRPECDRLDELWSSALDAATDFATDITRSLVGLPMFYRHLPPSIESPSEPVYAEPRLLSPSMLTFLPSRPFSELLPPQRVETRPISVTDYFLPGLLVLPHTSELCMSGDRSVLLTMGVTPFYVDQGPFTQYWLYRRGLLHFQRMEVFNGAIWPLQLSEFPDPMLGFPAMEMSTSVLDELNSLGDGHKGVLETRKETEIHTLGDGTRTTWETITEKFADGSIKTTRTEHTIPGPSYDTCEPAMSGTSPETELKEEFSEGSERRTEDVPQEAQHNSPQSGKHWSWFWNRK
jgi:hypothetical protein